MIFFTHAWKKFILLNITLFSLSQFCSIKPLAEWTMVVYAQANNSLAKFAHRNFSAMAKTGSTKDLNLLVQWYQPEKSGTWRYKIEKGRMVLDSHSQIPTDGTQGHELVDAMKWAKTKYPAKKYCLVLWNHGIGILDPLWGEAGLMMNPQFVKSHPRIQIAGITTPTIEPNYKTCDLLISNPFHRGILFNDITRTYMDNQTLASALNEISTKVLKKKIDLLGMDACLMAMLEVGYQVKDYAHYLVGSQEVELAFGWDYQSLVEGMTKKKLNALEVGELIVKGYCDYYKDKIQFYTQSLIQLDKLSPFKEQLNEVVKHYGACKNADKKGMQELVKTARNKCIQFSTPSYVDLHSFLKELHHQLQTPPQKTKLVLKRSLYTSKSMNSLRNALQTSMKKINQLVIASDAGSYLKGVKGLSVYFPQNYIDSSYRKTTFAADCAWIDFVEEFIKSF